MHSNSRMIFTLQQEAHICHIAQGGKILIANLEYYFENITSFRWGILVNVCMSVCSNG
jgi:hypothetical protein